jgi:hypothetical protein
MAVESRTGNPMTRLETLSPTLAIKLRLVPTEKQRAACVEACGLAVASAKVEHPLVNLVLRQLRAGHVLTPRQKADLDALATQLDEEYFSLQEAARVGEADKVDYLRAFAKARAVAALSFAGGDGPDAPSESIYETAAAVGDDKSALFSRIESILQGSNGKH